MESLLKEVAAAAESTGIDENILDLLVIGAGPHALSLLTRLVDDEPDLLSEKERVFTMSKAKHMVPKAIVRGHLKKRFDAAAKLPRTMVVDTHGQWMAQWAADFEALGIKYLRSHEHLHPCPYNFQSLTVWAEWQKRTGELKAMEQVDRDESRKAGFYGPFVVPSSRLFLDFCQSLVDRYGLASLINRGTVEDIRIIDDGSMTPRKFQVRLHDGRCLTARRVVCAMGPGPAFQGMRTELPRWAEGLTAIEQDTDCDQPQVEREGEVAAPRVQHSSLLTGWLRDPANKNSLAGARILIIGGGQTAAHLALLGLQQPGSWVTLCSRRRITKKMFDVDLVFAGEKRPKVLKQFWNLQEPKERVDFNAALRGGGSMSTDVYFDLVEASREDPARLELIEEAEVEQAHWLSKKRNIDSGEKEGEIHVRFDNGRLAHYDFVWLATGGDFDLTLVPIFASLMSQHPIPSVDGLPVLQDNLSWAKDVPLYVMGAFAQLQLGADALNLSGARSGSVVISSALY